jgi:hypothetical protein
MPNDPGVMPNDPGVAQPATVDDRPSLVIHEGEPFLIPQYH